MGEEALSQKAREALRHIRNWIMHNGKAPSVRELMNAMEYKSSRSALLLMDELVYNGFLEKKQEGGVRLLKDLEFGNATIACELFDGHRPDHSRCNFFGRFLDGKRRS